MADNPAMVAWQRALQGQLATTPESQHFPPDPNMGGVQNFIRALTSSTLNMPQTAVAGYRNIFGLPFGLGGTPPAPAAPAPVASVPSAPAPSIVLPPLKQATGQGEREFSFPAGPELPAPPMLPPPPQAKVVGGANYSKVKELADKGKPGAIDIEALNKAGINDILGGLASGAGSVSATEPGSFARALAMAGAGGAKGASTASVRKYEAGEEKDKQNQRFYQNRAELESRIVSAQQAAAAHAAQTAFNNAKLVWDTTVQNNATQYEFLTKKLQLEQPQIKQDANGVSITQMDPQTRQWKMRYVPTKPIFETLDKMKSTFDALGINSEAAKAANIQMLGQQYASDPLGGREVMKRLAVHDLVVNGAGSAVFGQAFQKAATAAKTELDAVPALQGKPDDYMRELNSRIAARILNMPEINTNTEWAVRGVAHSPYARVLAGTK